MSYQPIRTSHVIAKKRHRCIWCGERIAIGEQHIHEVSKFDGDFQDHRWHPECQDYARLNWRALDDDGTFEAHENERPPTAARIEYESWIKELRISRRRAQIVNIHEQGFATRGMLMQHVIGKLEQELAA